MHTFGYPFRLSSYFGLSSTERDEVLDLSKDGSHHIMDSGLFSFLFGGEKGKFTKYDQFKAYADKYVDTMHKWGWKHAIVDCDAQMIIGVDETQRLREEVFEKSGLEVIYVWHLPNGLDGLQEMAKKYKRIALSVPELRNRYCEANSKVIEAKKSGTVYETLAGPNEFVRSTRGGAKLKTVVLQLLKIVRDTGANPRVHLLGNTEAGNLTLPAESGDSSSWIYGSTFGKGHVYRAGGAPGHGKMEILNIRSPRWRQWVEQCAHRYPKEFAKLDKMRVPDRVRNSAGSLISFWMLMENAKQSAITIGDLDGRQY